MIGGLAAGTVNVVTTENRGLTPEEWAKMARERIISVADTVPEPLRAQATAYGDVIEKTVAIYMKKAIRSDRTTVYNALVDAGHPELAKAILNL